MASVKINCPQCTGFGLTGTNVLSVCSQCKGTGTITINDTDTVQTVNTASISPLVVISPKIPSTKVTNKQRDN